MIYKQYFVAISNHGQNSCPQPPNLLSAVCHLPELYREVIEVYRREYNFVLWYKNEKDFEENVSLELVRSMQHLTIGHGNMEWASFDHPRSRDPVYYPPYRNRPDGESGEDDEDSSFHVYRDFHNFNEFVWHDPL